MTVNMKWIFAILLILVTVWLPLNIHAEVYKWVDEHGYTHYGEKPPDANAQKIQIREITVDESIEIHNQQREKLLRIYEEERNLKKEEKLKAEKLKAEKEQHCQNLENELIKYQQGGFVYYDLDEKGERKYLSEAELSAHISKLQKYYDKNCK
ncbi:MAG: hypothetical protein A3I13_04100 [Gammaproteobacteria bacterium RIFCSPLOWO2_02_FULL_47_50]|nr:MAG: hypothetical protein A2W69_01565 [Gammaproteobacteria bacterium RIFCSPLOWO2_02_47_7]OGT73000.1 MAG: hypothetical protein A2W76_02865 [Gammaproteobacteria bacterium RIFCSPLOWO2_12_47_11]OGT79007.1 MAG: hypothetical protein A3I13_04100 [Gammaproteobacteria bacterium RIFCSPLOWO2_02_FULL_47_50]